MAKGFDAPPTLERSGSEHRRAVTSSLFGQERGLVRDVEPSLMVKKDGMILEKMAGEVPGAYFIKLLFGSGMEPASL